MRRPFLFLFGYERLRTRAEYAGEILELCRQRGYVYRDSFFLEGNFFLDCSPVTAKKLRALCAERGLPLLSERAFGIPALLHRYRQRVGIAVGLLLFAAILFFSGRVVWSIRVEGNRAVSDEEVLEELRRCGMTVGSPIGKLDTGVIENRVLILSDEISWISINMIGTVAEVEIREVEEIPEQEEELLAANLVAARSGKIEYLEDTRGNVAVEIGDVVEEGDLLVGGLYDNPNGGNYRYTCAKGKVFARTERDFTVEIPYLYEKKTYTGEVIVEKYLIFFEKEVKFFGNTGNSPMTCDTIDTVEYIELAGGVTLPVGIRTVRHMEYRVETASRNEEDAVELAQYRLRCLMESEVSEGMLVSKRMTASLTEEAYVLRCRAEYIENIAKTREIEIEGIS